MARSIGGKLSNEADHLVLRDAQGEVVDEVTYQLGFPWPTVGDPVPADTVGTGHSLQLINPLSDNDLGGSWRSAAPTPTGPNSAVYSLNVPPQVRQVRHAPQQPHSEEVVSITAKVTDPDGVDNVILQYQVVEPGHYIRLGDPEYSRLWTDVAMNDEGLNGDNAAGDSVYTVRLAKTLQVHRRLIRYRITALDTRTAMVTVPYEDDPQPNFAYFVYDGVPAWSGAIEPGSRTSTRGQVRTYGTDVMHSLPVYHLLSKASDVEDCQFQPIPDARCNPEAGLYQWTGALVYDGGVYDHIRYRARGGWATYEFGKNRWKFDFNRGHYFQARDDNGRPYPVKWDKLNFSACFQFDATNNRGEHGMYEAVTARLMALAGVPVSNMHWLQFRVIDDAMEADPQGAPSLVDVDRAMWDYHPRTRSQGSFYQSSPTGDFSGMVERMRAFISPGGWGYENIARIGRDALAPHTPVIHYAGPPGYPANALSFESSPMTTGRIGQRLQMAQAIPWYPWPRPWWSLTQTPSMIRPSGGPVAR